MPIDGQVLATDVLLLGDKNPDGTKDKNAWMQYGFDIDGKTSTGASTDVCKPQAGGTAAKAYPDGNGGIDNSFGKNVLPLFLTFSGTLTDDLNKSIANGGFTLMFRMNGLPNPPADMQLETLAYAGASLQHKPKYDGSDCWPVLRELLFDPKDIDSSKVKWPGSSVTAGLWSSGPPSTFQMSIPAAQSTLNLDIKVARLQMTLDPEGKGASGGQLGGVLETEQFIVEVKKLAGSIGPVFCSGPIIDGIIMQIRQASDIMKDGTQNPSATCDGISIGLGFSARPIQLGGIAPAVKPGPDPCAMQ